MHKRFEIQDLDFFKFLMGISLFQWNPEKKEFVKMKNLKINILSLEGYSVDEQLSIMEAYYFYGNREVTEQDIKYLNNKLINKISLSKLQEIYAELDEFKTKDSE